VPTPGGMSQRSTFAAPGALGWILALLPAACAHGATSPGFSSLSFDASALEDEAGASGDDGGPSGGPTPTSYLRFADWAPDGLPGFDICVAPHGSAPDAGTSMGPLLGAVVAFPGVSRYVPIPSGTYDVAIISQAAKACGSSEVPVIPLPTLANGARATVAIIGDLAPIGTDQAAQGIAFDDDVAGPPAKAAVRFLDVMPGSSPVVFGVGSVVSATFMPLTAAAGFGGPPAAPAMNGPAADPNGYLLLDPLRRGSISVQTVNDQGGVFVGSSTTFAFDGGFPSAGEPTVYAGESDVATGSNASWTAGSVVTVALIDGNWGTTPELMVCQDNAAPVGSPSSCAVLAP
jgi:hypothetical protein